jgi:hypothetical protein
VSNKGAGAYRAYSPTICVGGVYTTDRSDVADQRARSDFAAGTGKYRETTVAAYQPGGYGTYAAGTPYLDTDGDGIADCWEDSHGLNKNNAADGPAIAANGYSNLENFINELAGDIAPAPSITTNLITHYNFNDSAATATDVTGHGHTGTLVGSPTYTAGAPSLGNGMAFNGTTQYVTIPDATDLDLQSYTLAAWVKPAVSQVTWASVVTKVPSYYLYSSGAPPGHCATAGVPAGGHGGNEYTCGTTALTTGAWSHVAVTFDSATVRLYVNGVAVGTPWATAVLPAIGTELLQLANSNQGEWFQGTLDEVRVYSRALSPEEVTMLRDFVDPTTPPALTITTLSGSTLNTTEVVQGSATDDVGVTGISLACAPACGSPVVTCTPACSGTATSVTWTANVPLQLGANVITVSATDGVTTPVTKQVTLTLTMAATITNQGRPLGRIR